MAEYTEYAAHIPALMNLAIAAMCIHALLKLTKMRLDAQKIPKGQAQRRQEDGQPASFWGSFVWVGVNRLTEVIIAGIAIPDIPVLVKLITG